MHLNVTKCSLKAFTIGKEVAFIVFDIFQSICAHSLGKTLDHCTVYTNMLLKSFVILSSFSGNDRTLIKNSLILYANSEGQKIEMFF